MASITEGLFPSVAGLFATPGVEQQQMLQQARQPVSDPLAQVGGDIRFLQERGRQGINTAFGNIPEQDKKRQVFQQLVRNMQQQGVDISTPQGMVQLAQQMSSIPGLEGEALNLRQRAAQMAQQAQMQGLEAEKTRADIEKARRPEAGPKFSDPAQQALFEGFLREANGDPSLAARLMSEYKSKLKEREAAAGVPGSGEVKVTDLNTATGIVDRFTKDSKDRLSTVGRLRTLLSEAQGGSGTAVAQMRRELVKLVGDSQIGQGEVRDALGSLGIVGDVVSGINQVFTGTPSKEKLADVQRVINALESNVAKSYNSGIDRSRQVLTEGRLGKQTVESLLPPVYTPASAKKKSKFVEGKIYKDANGNRAVYKNGKFEPIQ